MKNQPLRIALVGNPNTGKTTLFNGLTGLKQKIANYPGVTVERKIGTLKVDDVAHQLIDLPGTYSLNHKKVDERITYQTLIGEYEYEAQPDLTLVVLDSSNLDRNLYLATQVMDLGLPMIVLLNMSDVAEERNISIDPEAIEQRLGAPVLSVSAKQKTDIERINKAIADHDLSPPEPLGWNPGKPLKQAIDLVVDEWLAPYSDLPARSYYIEALRLISDNQIPDEYYEHPEHDKAEQIVEKARQIVSDAGGNPMAEEVVHRYDFIGKCTGSDSADSDESEDTLTDKIDAVVTHKVGGPIIFVGILLLMFQSIFSWAEPFMNLIDLFFINLGTWVSATLPPGILNDLLVEGVIAGLGGVVIFLPQILFLFFFISVLEGTGYMARAAFVMDGFMTRIGLHGRSVVPMMSGFACAIPGIMATRTIENWRDRLITIMVLPFMACSARLPVYALMIAAFIPATSVAGFLSLQGLTFFGLYFFGIVVAIIAAYAMKQMFPTQEQTAFMMELPSYKMPKWSSVFYNMYERGRIFVTEAGKIIMAISVILWFLSAFPRVDYPGEMSSSVQQETASNTVQKASTNMADIQANANSDTGPVPESSSAYQLKHSYAGQFGQFIEPVVKPLGFDWKIGIGLLTSFAAREVMVGTLNTIYSIEDDGDNVATLQQKLINDKDPETGESTYSTLTAISLMVFFALAMQCMSTIAIVKRETNTWKWPIIMFTYMTTLAYICSLIVYQGGTALGW